MDKRREYALITDFWRVRCIYRDMESSPQAWTNYIKALDDVCRKYGGGIVEIGPDGLVSAERQDSAEAAYVNGLARAALNLAHYEQRGKR